MDRLVINEVLNEIAIRGLLHTYTVAEETVVPDILEGQDISDSLILFDRRYPSYWLTHQLIENGSFFLMRAACNANNEVKSFLAGEQDDIIVSLTLQYYGRKVVVFSRTLTLFSRTLTSFS